MFRKVMQVSDDLMWRYYELLTDRSLAEIESMQTSIAPDGSQGGARQNHRHRFPLGGRRRCRRRDLQRRGAPQRNSGGRPTVPMPDGVRVEGGIRVDKLLARVGLAESVSDAVRKIKAGAVQINGEKVKELLLTNPPAELLIQVGKNWKRVV